MHYYAIGKRLEANKWCVTFPDLPGCTAVGTLEDDVWARAPEVLQAWIMHQLEAGKFPPCPQSFEGRPVEVRPGLSDLLQMLGRTHRRGQESAVRIADGFQEGN